MFVWLLNLNMAYILSQLVCVLFLWQLLLTDANASEKTIEFSTSIIRNQIGQWLPNFSKDDQGNSKWKLNIKHGVTEYAGHQSSRLVRISSVSSLQPLDYELIPEIGYYKFHQKADYGFDDAVAMCAEEGGHLAIINSEKESQAIKELYARSGIRDDWAYVGFEKRRRHQWQTIFGEPLATTGFTSWAEGQPDNHGDDEFCGSITRDGLYNDIDCVGDNAFLCEYGLSWHNT